MASLGWYVMYVSVCTCKKWTAKIYVKKLLSEVGKEKINCKNVAEFLIAVRGIFFVV